MVTAIVLMNLERSGIEATAQQIAEIPGVSEVYSVSGRYDLIALLRVKSNEELARLVTRSLREVESILSTETLIAFQAYSIHDLEAMFSLGEV